MVTTSPDFYAVAERRIWRFQLALAVLGAAGAGWLAGWRGVAGFAVGAAVSSLNFRWLKQAVDALTEKATGSETRATAKKRKALVWKFVGRYLLMGAAAYGILTYTVWDIRALLAGLFLFVAAILAEICFELWNTPNSGSPGC
jgi:ATP synthase I subunit